MPLLDLNLIALDPNTTPEAFVEKLRQQRPDIKIVVASIPHHWVARPAVYDVKHLGHSRWDLMLVTEGELIQAREVHDLVKDVYNMKIGVPRKLYADYPTTNEKLLRQAKSIPLTGSLDDNNKSPPKTSQKLELSDDLRRFMDSFTKERGEDQPVTMLNLLCFKPNSQKQYATYGQHFQTAGGRRGGNAKMVGSVVKSVDKQGEQKWWDEVAIVHYPSIRHFCDMAAGDDYQEINQKYRLPSLEDTILLCTTELPRKTASKL
ncbi:hypothetical protein BDZ85DRAFT_89515 [Elsinoe ampelina]|uniref:EthD domain-containing protein n=1 Tax=Elsinoe ampelina TaxID=302913 RepID=A0A6A6GI77_9PEZI|nr:hypothetical protein BDZ85DRAFT_89515 [Elsinoe ampelina]